MTGPSRGRSGPDGGRDAKHTAPRQARPASQARVAWPDYDEQESEDERPGYHCSFIDRPHALVSSSEGRMFVLDLMSMRFVAELHVEGHAPVPLSMKYPGQVGPGLTSDLVAFSRCGDAIVAFFAEGRGASAASFAALPFAALSGSAPLRG